MSYNNKSWLLEYVNVEFSLDFKKYRQKMNWKSLLSFSSTQRKYDFWEGESVEEETPQLELSISQTLNKRLSW